MHKIPRHKIIDLSSELRIITREILEYSKQSLPKTKLMLCQLPFTKNGPAPLGKKRKNTQVFIIG